MQTSTAKVIPPAVNPVTIAMGGMMVPTFMVENVAMMGVNAAQLNYLDAKRSTLVCFCNRHTGCN